MKKNILFICCLLSASLSYAGNTPTGFWYMYFGSASFENTKWKAAYDVQYRNHNFMGDLNQLLIRGSAQYAVASNLTLGVGYAFVQTEKIGEPDEPFTENRIFQDVLTQQTIGTNVLLKHRFRLEQRFIEQHDYKSRIRYQLGLDVPVYTNTEKKQSAYASFYNEVFMNLDEKSRKTNAFDRNRLYFGAGFKFNPKLGIQVGWMNQMLQKDSYQQIMLSVHHNLNL